MKKTAPIYYFSLTDEMLREDKLNWFASTKFEDIPFERIEPDKNYNWLNITDNDFDALLVLADKKSKNTVFNLNNPGVSTNRDLWVYDLRKSHLVEKINYTIQTYNSLLTAGNSHFPELIKWSHVLKRKFSAHKKFNFSSKNITYSYYRPFFKVFYYCDLELSDLLTDLHFLTYGKNLQQDNFVINFTGPNSQKPFMVLANNHVSDLHFVGAAAATQCLPLYRYDSEGNRTDNITDWGLKQFRTHYQDDTITKENIFHYTYAVLHHPAYREKYALNLKREFPRLPFYEDFSQWVTWGKQLMNLHLNYEQAKKYTLKRVDIETNQLNKPRLKVDKEAGKIYLDTVTTLQGIPSIAWDYKLGNRSALEWILDQYKEKKPRDKTIAEKFNTYRFTDYKIAVIDLLQRVCTVSVETMKIIDKMP